MFIAAAIAIVSALMIGFQLVTGTAYLGTDHIVERDKAASQFWFVMGLEFLALVVGILAVAAFRLG